MKVLSLRKDLKVITIYKSDLDQIIDSISAMSLFSSNEICLDLTGYYVDYQVTPHIISFFLDQLSKIKGEKKFIIIHSGIGSKEELMLYDLIFDNSYFNIEYKPTEETISDYKNTINSKLISNNISMTVDCIKDKKEYKYGN